MINNPPQKAEKSGFLNWIQSVASVLAIGVFTYTLFLQVFVGFVSFGLVDKFSGDGASFDQVLRYQIAEGRVETNSTIFSIQQDDSIISIAIGQELPKFLAFNLNYLSADDIKLKISFQSNSSEVAQDYLTIVQGIQHYKVPNVGNFDTLLITSQNQGMTKMGVNGISALTQLGVNKLALGISLFVSVLYLLAIYWRRVRCLDYWIDSIKDSIKNFKRFVVVNRFGLSGLTFISIVGYGFFVTNFTLSIDEELFWMIKDGAPWVGYGRFGNYFLDRYLTIDSSVVPYFTDFFSVVFLLFSAVIFLYSWAQEQNEIKIRTAHFVIAGGLFLTFPFVNADFMAFSIYNLWLSLGYVFTALSVILTRSHHKKIISINSLAIVLSLTAAISIYQSFISVYVMILAILELRKVMEEKSRTLLRQWIPPVFLLFAATCLYFALNFFAQRTITAGYGYIGTFVGWNKETNPLTTLKGTLNSIISIYLGNYGTSGRILTIVTALFLGKILVSSLGSGSLIATLRIFLSSALVIIAPFSIVLFLGSMLPARSLVGLPLFLSGAWLIITTKIEKRQFQNFFVAIGFTLLLFQLQYLNMVFYGDYLRYQNDLHLGRSIVAQIEAEGFDYRVYPIVFLGERDIDVTKLISTINSGGRSFFDDSSQSYRMSYFLRTIGYPILLPSQGEIQKANSNPPFQSWPKKGSIIFDGSVIKIKLSD